MAVLIQNQEFEQCQHVKINGVRCGSPSLREREHCYFHNRLRRLHAAPVFPMIEDTNTLQYALSEVLDAILEDRVDMKKASMLTYTLQVAAYNLRTGVNFEPPAEQMVREDPAEAYFDNAMKQLPEKASVTEVLTVLKTYAKG